MIDLHTHSTISDGSDAPAAIIDLAAAAGCAAVALTDHDRLDGLEEAGARADELGVTLVPGCELSCESKGTMHVLVYFVEPGAGPLQDELGRLQRARFDRNRALVSTLAGLGIPVTWDEVVAKAGGEHGIGRPHFASVLVDKGAAASVQDAFDRWLAKGRPGYLEKERLEPPDALRLACESGGVAVLAHPLSLELDPVALEARIGELKDMGLAGVEAIYGRYTPEDRDGLVAVADRLGLVATGGSDHHGTFKPDLQVGVGRGDLHVPDSVLEDLMVRR